MTYLLYTGGAVVREFGYVVVVILFAIIENAVFGFMVGKARKKFHVPAPTMYAVPGIRFIPSQQTQEELAFLNLDDEQVEEFNRYQRAHQNNLEQLPQFFVLMIIGGLSFPIVTTVAGFVWLIGRALYAYGYYKSSKGRRIGSVYHIGEIMLLGVAVAFAVNLLRREVPY